ACMLRLPRVVLHMDPARDGRTGLPFVHLQLHLTRRCWSRGCQEGDGDEGRGSRATHADSPPDGSQGRLASLVSTDDRLRQHDIDFRGGCTTMASATSPTQYRFSFGPWNISTGADPFGPPARKEMDLARKIKAYKELGFDAVQFHDDDIVPADIDWPAT